MKISIRLSGLALVLANLIPLIGVIVWDWSVFEIVLLYWSENLIIGAIHFVKMAVILHPHEVDGKVKFNFKPADKLFILPFFIFHYGIFCLVHGVFVFVLLGKDTGYAPMDAFVFMTIGHLALAFWGLLISHVISFFVNFIGRGLYKKGEDGASFEDPYGRIVVLHLAIVLGAFVCMALDSPILLLVILIIGKFILDLKFHIRANSDKMKRETGEQT